MEPVDIVHELEYKLSLQVLSSNKNPYYAELVIQTPSILKANGDFPVVFALRTDEFDNLLEAIVKFRMQHSPPTIKEAI